MMKHVIITGACGFIGQALTLIMLEKGIKVTAVCMEPSRLDHMPHQEILNIVQASFGEYNTLPSLVNAKGADCFYHLAWAGYGKDTNNPDVQSSNSMYAAQAAQAASEIGCKKFLLAGSSHEFQKNDSNDGNRIEVGYCSIYGAAKRSAQYFCRAIAHNNNMEFGGFFFTNVFGIGDRSQRSTNTIIAKLLNNEDIDLIKGDYLYDWVYVDDVVKGLFLVGEKGKAGKMYYVGSNELRPFKDIITDVRNTLSPKSKLNFGTYEDTSYIDYGEFDIYSLYKDTGYRSECDFSESVRKTADWLKKQ